MTPEQHALRIRRLQRVCLQNGLEAILLVVGLDGKFNAGCHQTLGYIFEGRCGRDVLDFTKLSELNEELVLCIRTDIVHIYTPNASTVNQLLPFLCNACIYAPSPMETQDLDSLEALKVGSFVQMLRGLKGFGTCLPLSDANASQYAGSSSDIESWPLVLAYGLEGVGRPGFLTMNFKVEDVTESLHRVYTEIDACSLQSVLQNNSLTLNQHWLEAIKGISQRPFAQRSQLTERQIAEPLLGYFSYGMLRPVAGVKQVVTMLPRVVFGPRTASDTATCDAVSISNSRVSPGMPCLHMVLEGADPRSALRVARTYFLTAATTVPNLFGDELAAEAAAQHAAQGQEGDVDQDVAVYTPDAVSLMRLYLALSSAGRQAMVHFALTEGATAHSARQVACEVLLQRAEQLGVAMAARAAVMKFALWSCDHCNIINATPERGSRQLKVVRVALLDIRSSSPNHQGAVLGGLVYADTFMEVIDAGSPPRLLVLTEQVPGFMSLASHGCEAASLSAATLSFNEALAQAAHDVQVGLSSAARPMSARPRSAAPTQTTQRQRDYLEEEEEEQEEVIAGDSGAELAANGSAQDPPVSPGALPDRGAPVQVKREYGGPNAMGTLLSLGGGDGVVLLTGCDPLAAIAAMMYCFEKGLVLIDSLSRHMWVVDLRADVESVTLAQLMVAGQAPLGPALLLRGVSAACGLAPACHLTSNKHLALCLDSLPPESRRHFNTVILPAWQTTCRQSEVSYLKDPQPTYPYHQEMYSKQLAAVNASTQVYPVSLPTAAVEAALQCLDTSEMKHNASSASLEVEALLLATPSPSSTSLVLVVGLPGADQEVVGAALAETLGARSPCVLGCSGRAATHLHVSQLEKALEHMHQSAGPQVLVSCSFDSLPQLLHHLASAATRHRRPVALLSVIAVVSSDMVFEDPVRERLLPGWEGVLAPGFVDAVVLAGTGQHLTKVQALIAERLPSVPVVRAPPSNATTALQRRREQLLPDATERAQRVSAEEAQRRFAWPPCAPAPLVPAPLPLMSGSLQVGTVQFQGALDTSRLLDSCRALGLCRSSAAMTVPLEDPAAQPFCLAYLLCLFNSGEGLLSEVLAWRGCAAALVRERSALPGAALLECGSGCGRVVCVGSGLSQEQLRELVQGWSCPPPAAVQLRDRKSLTPDDIAAVRALHLQDPLPDGVYFDGANYYDSFGDLLKQHPDMERFLQEYLAGLNMKLQQENAALAAHRREALSVTHVHVDAS